LPGRQKRVSSHEVHRHPGRLIKQSLLPNRPVWYTVSSPNKCPSPSVRMTFDCQFLSSYISSIQRRHSGMHCEYVPHLVFVVYTIRILSSAYSCQLSMLARFAPNLDCPPREPRLGGQFLNRGTTVSRRSKTPIRSIHHSFFPEFQEVTQHGRSNRHSGW
jgi:hypothetical protein